MVQTSRNIVLGLIGAGIAGGLLFVTFRPEPIPVDLHTVKRDHFEVTVDVDGTTRVVEVFEVSAPIAGVVQRSPVRVGDPVVAGETVVALVEPISPGLLDARSRLQAEAAVSEAEAALHVAETELASAREDHVYSKSHFERTTELVERGVATITRLEEAQQRFAVADAALDAANARIAQAQGGLRRAEAALVETSGNGKDVMCCMSLFAPSDGVVLDIDEVSARPVPSGARLLTIGDPGQIELVADLLTSDAVSLPPNARAYVERWGGQPLEARLAYVEPAARMKVSALGIEEQRVDVVFDIVTPTEMRPDLGHEFAVYLRVVTQEETDALLVPLSAAFRIEDGWAVFRTEGDRVARIPVDLGARNGRYAVVQSGLEPGDRIVEHPHADLTDGALFEERTTF
ncbi:HlyD family efflux transporter periplasmic adaptor subunit [uncultured Tateyamaria sp.]|uniref:efflux RND transporter periplasmic adaptor subunit n=1 Tax=uncultured Tateyamaria sp. TaxID=455651 RepID=UPI002605A298|nr:HlyD family efflux transporter periplasmic adaptor subunit [uncultured Tateyamaria sp.]